MVNGTKQVVSSHYRCVHETYTIEFGLKGEFEEYKYECPDDHNDKNHVDGALNKHNMYSVTSAVLIGLLALFQS